MEKHLRNVVCALRFLLNITLFSILLGGQLPALNPDTPVNQYIVDHWEENNKGLPSNLIITIVQTPDGYIWFGTSKGLVRFDGIKFSAFQFIQGKENEQLKNSNLNIDILLVDREKNLWIGSNAGLTRCRLQTGEFKTFTHNDGLPKDHIRFLKEDREGNLWISFFNGYLGCYTNNKFTLFNESHGLDKYKINTIIENQEGILLLGTRENGLLEFREGKFLQVPAVGLDSSYIITMYEDRAGDRWIGTNKGLSRTTVTGKNYKYTTGDGLADDYITDIMEDSDGNLWVGTVKGLTRIQKTTPDTLVFDCVLKPFTIMCLLEDNEKNVWVGTYDSGIQCLKNNNFRTFDALNGQPGEILLCQFEDRNRDTWIGSLGGKLFQCRGNELIGTITFPGISGVGITCISDDAAGNLWLGSNGNGVWQWNKKTLLQLTTREGLADNMVTSITRDSRDNLWFCTLNGVSCYKNGRLETFRQIDGLLGKNAHNVYE
ncbi:MAG: hypothetical protein MUF15_11345, partial [Acidobacteria bacterium]|nr:hypothetical protein [Acidobacteriota bacterium]